MQKFLTLVDANQRVFQMYKAFGSYEYSQSRKIDSTVELAPLCLDYNEYFGAVHPDTIEVFKNSSELLASYFRPSENSLESRLSQAYGIIDLQLHLVSGADHALEEILGYCRNQLQLKTFHSFHLTTYDHFYTFAQKLGFELTGIESAQIIYVCCPNNPDGIILTSADCARMLSSNPEKIFLFDFSYLAYSTESYSSYISVLKDFPNTYFISSLAKILPIAGLRSGWFCTTDKTASQYFKKFLNAKMINPIAREVLASCLKIQDFYFKQTREIFSNRQRLADLIISFLATKGINSSLKYQLDQSGGNFFSVQFVRNDDLKNAISSLEEARIYIRHKPHWDFIRITSVNNVLLRALQDRLL